LLAKLQKNVEANRQKDELYAARAKPELTGSQLYAARVKPELTESLPDTWEAISADGPEKQGNSCADIPVERNLLTRDSELDERLKADDDAASARRGQQLMDFRRKLPSYQKRGEVIDLVNKHQVILISGETGCGKTTQVNWKPFLDVLFCSVAEPVHFCPAPAPAPAPAFQKF
jgi:HrpA-like RNA helicase